MQDENDTTGLLSGRQPFQEAPHRHDGIRNMVDNQQIFSRIKFVHRVVERHPSVHRVAQENLFTVPLSHKLVREGQLICVRLARAMA